MSALFNPGARFRRMNPKYFWVIEGDISSCFGRINHRKLIHKLRRKIDDEKFLNLIWKFLRAGVMEGKLFKGTTSGTPQGGIVTPPTMLRTTLLGAPFKRGGTHP